MEKPAAGRSKGFSSGILNFLPKTPSAVTIQFQSPPLSPTHREARLRAAVFGGRPSLVPAEARRKPKNGGLDAAQEPTSPVVTCIGRIKQKKKEKIEKMKKKRSESKRVTPPPQEDSESNLASVEEEKKKKSWGMWTAFWGLGPGKKSHGANEGNFEDRKPRVDDDRKSRVDDDRKSQVDDDCKFGAPPLDQMKRFASGRDALSSFDWKALSQTVGPDRPS